ncbi:alternate-type signal peptide domain-containing protein [Nocardioides dongkuii]|uniref:alternate-type signal peptide domain-containing protein n=1 Tax=Nocardioides dongkuii TaxID=2760089 RepID=UPI0015FA6843|nr:alternate-type signal peptide domain-containing protein [Nocardioides dongkuii]
MNKTAKGALAAGTAAVLLMGGAGSLAYWTDSVTGGAGTGSSGKLSIVPATTGTWTHNGRPVTNPVDVVAVPGDEFLYSGTYTIGATGTDLQADLDITEGAVSGTFAPDAVTVTPTFTLGTTPLGASQQITAADNGKTLAVGIEVDFAWGAEGDNASQGKKLNLTDYTVTLTQTDKLAAAS